MSVGGKWKYCNVARKNLNARKYENVVRFAIFPHFHVPLHFHGLIPFVVTTNSFMDISTVRFLLYVLSTFENILFILFP